VHDTCYSTRRKTQNQPIPRTTHAKIPALAVVIAAFSLTATVSQGAFVLLENFDQLNAGQPLNGQGGWTANAVATVLDTGGGDKVANLATGGTGNLACFHSLGALPGGLTIANTNAAATVYFNFTVSVAGVGNNWNFIVTDAPSPGDTSTSSEVQLNFDGGTALAPILAMRARSAGNFLLLSTAGSVATDFLPLVNVQYNGWFEIDNTTDTYKLFLQSDGDARVLARTQMLADGTVGAIPAGTGTFTFRNSGTALQTTDLVTANFGSSSGTSVVRFDDIYVDTAGFNSFNPVPEPAQSGIMLAAGAVILLRPRR
jgi:hypothetical protein